MAATLDNSDNKNSDWRCAISKKYGKLYYYNKNNKNECQWKPPKEYIKPDWVEVYANKNNDNAHYVNIKTKEICQKPPKHYHPAVPPKLKRNFIVWRELWDEKKLKFYYFNKITKKVTWKKPKTKRILPWKGKDIHDSNTPRPKGKKIKYRTRHNVLNNKKKSPIKKHHKIRNKQPSLQQKNHKKSNINNNQINETYDIKNKNVNNNNNDIDDESEDEEISESETHNPNKLRKFGDHWRQVYDAASGRYYYFHKQTKQVSWTLPKDVVEDLVSSRKSQSDDTVNIELLSSHDSEDGTSKTAREFVNLVDDDDLMNEPSSDEDFIDTDTDDDHDDDNCAAVLEAFNVKSWNDVMKHFPDAEFEEATEEEVKTVSAKDFLKDFNDEDFNEDF